MGPMHRHETRATLRLAAAPKVTCASGIDGRSCVAVLWSRGESIHEQTCKGMNEDSSGCCYASRWQQRGGGGLVGRGLTAGLRAERE